MKGTGTTLSDTAYELHFRFFIKVAGGNFSSKAVGYKARATACDIDVLANQVAVYTRFEVIKTKVNIAYAAIQMGGEVVAQIFRVQM